MFCRPAAAQPPDNSTPAAPSDQPRDSNAQRSLGIEQQALEYLLAEVQRWPEQNHCFSCHNNGDGARVIYRGIELGLISRRTDTDELKQWLRTPTRWQLDGGDEPDSDQRVADLQFALALAQLRRAGDDVSPQASNEAAQRVVQHLQPDGSWPADPTSKLGSPVTYGASLGTALARQLLIETNAQRFAKPIGAARSWLLATEPASTPDAAARLLGLSRQEHVQHRQVVEKSVELLLSWQAADGGWGPYPRTRTEVFDTAVAILALAQLESTTRRQDAIARGRSYLVAHWVPRGGWSETTRPSGRESYAQHISTTAWATLALVETRPPQPPQPRQTVEPDAK